MGFFSRLFGRGAGQSQSASEADALAQAALTGDVGLLQEALECGLDVNDGGRAGVPPLVLALVKTNEEIADALISAGADVNRPDPKGGMAPLHAAAMHGLEGTVQKLLAQGANFNATFGQPPVAPLALAFRKGHRGVVRLLLEAGADPNTPVTLPSDPPDQRGMTTLLYAASEGDLEMVRLLVERRADLNAFKADGLTPLMVAAFSGQLEVVKALVERGANVNLIHAADPSRPFSAIDLAAMKGHGQVVEYLKSRGSTPVARGVR